MHINIILIIIIIYDQFDNEFRLDFVVITYKEYKKVKEHMYFKNIN